MKSTGKENNKLTLRSSCTTTFRTLYGIGKVKAIKINSFLLNHPSQQKFNIDLQLIMNTIIGSNILSRIPFGGKVRICVYIFMEKKINTYCYKAHRLFQNLPTRGQRTRTNANTSRKRNPYQILEMNLKFFKGASIAYKRLELIHNQRYDELKAYDKNLQDIHQKQKEVNTESKKKKKN
jgi:ribosomal protein S13